MRKMKIMVQTNVLWKNLWDPTNLLEKLTNMKKCCIISSNALLFLKKIVATENHGGLFVGFCGIGKNDIEASSGDEHPKFTFSSCSHMAGSFPWRLGLGIWDR